MTAEQVIALVCLIADLRMQVSALSAENAQLRQRLELATGDVKRDDETLAAFARQLA